MVVVISFKGVKGNCVYLKENFFKIIFKILWVIVVVVVVV